MIATNDMLNGLLERLDEVVAQKPEYEERFDFYKRVLGYLMDSRKDLRARLKNLTEEQTRLRLAEGFPLMDRLKLTPDLETAAVNFRWLSDLVEKERGLEKERMAALRETEEQAGGLEKILLGYFHDEEEGLPSGKTPVPEENELWRFLLHCSLKPYYEIHGMAYGEMVESSAWDEGFCPICGGNPAMGGFVDEEGRRVLLCHRCGFVWDFRRVKCPFCGSTDQEKLKYIFFDQEPSYRIDVCEECRIYLKGVDSRKHIDEVILEAEDLVTPHLDLIAQKEGYSRKSPNILGL
jgi:FdhE protein